MNGTATKRISSPHHEVFAAMSNFVDAPSRISGITRVEMLTPGAVGKGTRFRETRTMFGREQTETMEVVEWSPPSHYVLEANSCGCQYRFTVSCKADGAATIVQMTFQGKPLTFMAKLFSPLGKLMAGMCRKAIEKDLNDLEKSFKNPAAQLAS